MNDLMTKHYSEADLLETYYTQPGESMPVMMHLAGCSACAAKYERLEKKLRGISSCPAEKPQTFWSRQRLSIMRRVDAKKNELNAAARTWRIAAAAVLAFVLGGSVVYETVKPQLRTAPPPVTQSAAQTAVKPADDTVHDAWQSDELHDFHGMVQWESWVADNNNKTATATDGGDSL